MHIEALALPVVIRDAEVAKKCLFTSIVMEKKIREFVKWPLHSKRKADEEKEEK